MHPASKKGRSALVPAVAPVGSRVIDVWFGAGDASVIVKSACAAASRKMWRASPTTLE